MNDMFVTNEIYINLRKRKAIKIIQVRENILH